MRRLHIIIILLLLALAGALGGCRPGHDARLDRAAALADTLPDSALTLLMAIDPGPLGRADRARHALLLVKATDKAYLTHDSLSYARQRLAMDYYRSHGTPLERAEAHYYAGRLAADSLHYATALHQFDQTISQLMRCDTTSTEVRHLLACALSQTAQTLDDLKLHDEALPYYSRSVRYDSITRDTIGWVCNLRDMALIHNNKKRFGPALALISRADSLSQSLTRQNQALTTSLRHVIYRDAYGITPSLEEFDSLLEIIGPRFSTLTLLAAAKKAYSSGNDTLAAEYARRVVESPQVENKIPSYTVLIRSLMKIGEIAKAHDYELDYLSYINKQRKEDGKEYLRAMERNRLSDAGPSPWPPIAVMILFLFAAGYDFMKDRASRLSSLLITRKGLLREMESVLSSQESAADYDPVSTTVESKAVATFAATRRPVAQDSPLWGELQRDIELSSPEFGRKVRLLYPKISLYDFHLLLLVKAGIQPLQMSVIMCCAKNTISSRRARMAEKLFGRKLPTAEFDRIIHQMQ